MERELIYFLRAEESFDDFIHHYNLNKVYCKNEPLFDYELNASSIHANIDVILITSLFGLKSLIKNHKS
jgi:hypothetical protein